MAAHIVGSAIGRDPLTILAPPYHDDQQIRSDLVAAGFTEIELERVSEPSRAASAREAGMIVCPARCCGARSRRTIQADLRRSLARSPNRCCLGSGKARLRGPRELC